MHTPYYFPFSYTLYFTPKNTYALFKEFFLYFWMILKLNVAKFLHTVTSSHWKHSMNLNMLTVPFKCSGRHPFLSSLNSGHSTKQWYSSSMTLHRSHFLSLMSTLLLPHLPVSILNMWERNFWLEMIAFLFHLLSFKKIYSPTLISIKLHESQQNSNVLI